MAEWTIGRAWSDAALREHLDRLSDLARNFDGSHEDHLLDPTWKTHRSRSRIGTVDPGPPAEDGPFARGVAALSSFAFSDPAIVEAHFDPRVPLKDRRMLLELKVPLLRYLCGVAVAEIRSQVCHGSSVFGFRYDTLEGHVERGSEWFLIRKNHDSGAVNFEIEATWREGEFPNWWSHLGFKLVGRWYQRRWLLLSHRRMAAFLARRPLVSSLADRGLPHRSPEIAFSHTRPRSSDG